MKTNIKLILIFLLVFFISIPIVNAEYDTLYVDGFDTTYTAWDTEDAPSPYLDNSVDNWIHEEKTSGADEGYFSFEDVTVDAIITNVTIYIECYGDDTNDNLNVYINGVNRGTVTVDQTSYGWEILNLDAVLTSEVLVNNANLWLEYIGIGGGDDIYVRRAYLYVGYYFPELNTPSINYQLSITDFDDADNLYSEKKYYNLDYDGYDLDGYGNVSYVKIYINQSVTSRAIFNYNEDTNTFSLISGNWEIDVGGSSASRTGTDLNLTFKITPSWDAIEESDIELEATINDGASSDHDIMQTNYADVITTLLTSSIEYTDVNNPDRVNTGVNSSQWMDFAVMYADNPASVTPSNDYPPDAEFTSISVYNSTNDNMGDDITITNGVGKISFYKTGVKSETYNLYVNMNDADYTDAEITTPTETIIWDRILIDGLIVADDRININAQGQWYCNATLEYDGHGLSVFDGFTLSGQGFTHVVGVIFRGTTIESTVQQIVINSFDSGNEVTYGITVGNINGQSQAIIWDRIIILTLDADDSRIDINTVGTWYSTAELEYDNHVLGVGDSFILSTYSFTWNGTYFISTDNEATVQQHIINAFDSGSEVTYGITVGDINGQSQSIIWDRLIITFNVDDNAPPSNTDATFTVDIEYDYDAVNCTTYYYDINRNGTLYQDDLEVRGFIDNQPSPTMYIYDVIFLNETLYGLTVYVDDSDITVQWQVSIVIGDVTLLFGGGFNHSIPYVYLRWNYSGYVDNYEIYHSTDNVTYLSLVLTPNKHYNHTLLVNGSYHYYKVRSTYFSGVWYNSSFSPINLERVWFIHGSGGGSVSITYVDGSWYEYNVSLITIVKGTYVSGNLTSMIVNDADYYIVDEVIGVEGFDIRLNFTDIPIDILSLSIRTLSNYVGNPAHNKVVEVFNHSSNNWITLYPIAGQGAFEWGNHSLSLGRGINNIGNVWCRIVHPTNGVNTHYIEIDYIKLRGFIATSSGGSTIGLFNNFIILGFLSMIGVVGYKLRRF